MVIPGPPERCSSSRFDSTGGGTFEKKATVDGSEIRDQLTS